MGETLTYYYNFRQSIDRYGMDPGTESLKNFPMSSDFDPVLSANSNANNINMDTLSYKQPVEDATSMRFNMAQSANNGSIANTALPQTPIAMMSAPTPMPGFQPSTIPTPAPMILPQGPQIMSQPNHPNLGVNHPNLAPNQPQINPHLMQFHSQQNVHNQSDDSLPSAYSLQTPMMDPRGSGRQKPSAYHPQLAQPPRPPSQAQRSPSINR